MTRGQAIRSQQDQFNATILSLLKIGAKALPAAIIVTIVIIFVCKIYERITGKIFAKSKFYGIAAMSFYAMAMLQLAIISRPIGSVNEIDLIPFNTPGGGQLVFLYATANAIVFIPLGVLLPIISTRMKNWKKVVSIGLCISILIELIQLVMKCGMCQTEDVIMNTIGTGVGFWVYDRFRVHGKETWHKVKRRLYLIRNRV